MIDCYSGTGVLTDQELFREIIKNEIEYNYLSFFSLFFLKKDHYGAIIWIKASPDHDFHYGFSLLQFWLSCFTVTALQPQVQKDFGSRICFLSISSTHVTKIKSGPDLYWKSKAHAIKITDLIKTLENVLNYTIIIIHIIIIRRIKFCIKIF